INNCQYLVDVGFANNSLRQALPLDQQVVDAFISKEKYRFLDLGAHTVIETEIGTDEWLCLYALIKKPVFQHEAYSAHETLYLTNEIVPVRDSFFLAATVNAKNRKYLCAMKGGRAFYKSFSADTALVEKQVKSCEEFVHILSEELGMKADANLRCLIVGFQCL
ncbi:MAG: arylamine N-acetyltransferase, partial [Pseudomonadota bacterium]|nr:arylamine N-acetyltransferase [Pseudomonadota bacterium]